jgi:TRAP-type mannitol/chloroaromatic compound transport system permease small subunit
MDTLLQIVDRVSAGVGSVMRWVAVAIVVLAAYEVVMRYVFNSPTQWGYEILLMLGAAMYSLSWAYVHSVRGHIRVDVLYTRLSARGRGLIDVVLTLLYFFPLIGVMVYMSGDRMIRAWETGEKSIETYWYPPLGPVRTAVFLGFCLFALQGVAQFIRDLRQLLGSQGND